MCNRMELSGYCSLAKDKGECDSCKRNHKIYASRRIATIVEAMNEASDVHILNELYNAAEKELFMVYGARFNRLMLEASTHDSFVNNP